MDYEKKYKDAVSAIKFLLYKSERGNFTADKYREELESIIPELKESEDEKIRKAIIEIVKKDEERIGTNAHLKKIQWLEKQGEQKPVVPMFRIGDVVENVFTHDQRRVTSIKDDSYITDNVGFIGFHDQDDWVLVEQKPADKIEPKFHEGDWIINNEHNNVAKVLEINNEQYRLDYCDTVGTISIALIDNDYHLWTIQDAKAGDVLASDYEGGICIALLKNVLSISEIEMYCHLINDDLFIPKSGYSNAIWHPATKEQRDKLEKAMADAGYTFDFEKKELKKIEQSPLDVRTTGYWHVEDVEQKPAWSEEDDEHLERILKELENQRQRPINISCLDKIESDYNWLKSFKERVQPQPKQEWSEEDESWFKEIELMCLNFSNDTDYREKFSTWLKSLKDRVLPQPKQEWSEENEKMIGNIRSIIEKYAFSKSAVDVNGELCEKEYIEADNWLKSLRPQNTWKPSDEHLRALEIVGAYKDVTQTREVVKQRDVINNLLEQLKAL